MLTLHVFVSILHLFAFVPLVVFRIDKGSALTNPIGLTGLLHVDNLPIIYENRLAPDLSTITDLDVQAFTKKFLNIFDEKELNIILRALSRALAGHFEDKKWYSLIGLRNFGKGVLQ